MTSSYFLHQDSSTWPNRMISANKVIYIFFMSVGWRMAGIKIRTQIS